MTMLGRKHSESSKKKMSLNASGMKGKKHKLETLKKMRLIALGRKHSKETLLKLSKNHANVKGSNNPFYGQKHKTETRLKISGRNSPSWKGGITPLNKRLRMSIEYKLWRKTVFERDNYTCVWCGVRGGEIHADHIKPFAYFPELRFAIDNGRTLCVPCHKTTDTWGSRAKKI